MNPGSRPRASKENQVYRAHTETEQTSDGKVDKKTPTLYGSREASLYAELTMRDKDEKMKVKIFTVSLGIKGQEASEMLLPGIMPETLE